MSPWWSSWRPPGLRSIERSMLQPSNASFLIVNLLVLILLPVRDWITYRVSSCSLNKFRPVFPVSYDETCSKWTYTSVSRGTSQAPSNCSIDIRFAELIKTGHFLVAGSFLPEMSIPIAVWGRYFNSRCRCTISNGATCVFHVNIYTHVSVCINILVYLCIYIVCVYIHIYRYVYRFILKYLFGEASQSNSRFQIHPEVGIIRNCFLTGNFLFNNTWFACVNVRGSR